MMIPKFRAWLIGQEYMAEIEAIAFRGDGNVDVYTSLSGNDFYTVGEECELMQSIGLHDKNGVEIFHRDLITHEGYIYEIIAWSMGFVAKSKTLLGEIHLPPYLINESLVIGNIYKDPELLEQQNG